MKSIPELLSQLTPQEKTMLKEFRRCFVEPKDSDLRVIDLNNEKYVMGSAKDVEAFLLQAIRSAKKEALDEAIAIFKKLPEDEPMTKNPVILELEVLKENL